MRLQKGGKTQFNIQSYRNGSTNLNLKSKTNLSEINSTSEGPGSSCEDGNGFSAQDPNNQGQVKAEESEKQGELAAAA